MQLDRYFVSQSSEFCRYNPLCCFSTSVYCCKRIFRYDSVRKLFDTSSYIVTVADTKQPYSMKCWVSSDAETVSECEISGFRSGEGSYYGRLSMF
jgi:hypothetical protein